MKLFAVKNKTLAIHSVVIAIFAVICFAFFQYLYPYHFFYKEQNQLFLMSCTYLETYFDKPAWASCLIGDFLTQFYYYLYLGAVILTLSLLTMGDILRRALQRAGLGIKWSFAIAVIMMTVEGFCHFSESFALSSTISIIGGAAMFYLLSVLLKVDKIKCLAWAANTLVLFFAALSYWMFGYGWLIFIIIAVISGFRYAKFKRAVIRLLYIPLMLVCISFMKSSYLLDFKENVCYPGIGSLSLPDMEFEKYLAVDNEYYFGNDNKAIAIADGMKEKLPSVSFFRNLAYARQGMLPDAINMAEPTNLGTFIRISDKVPMIAIKQMNELYYALGDMTFTERAAIMACAFSPNNRNVRMVKRLAEANLVKNDIPAAMKYLRILDKTVVYHQWAEEHTPGTQTALVKKEIAEKRKYINTSDTIRTTDNCRDILLSLLHSNPANVIALDYLLCSDLVSHNIGMFKADYDAFLPKQNRIKNVLLYKQALAFYESNKPKNE